MKKLISIMLVLVLAAGTFALAGCGNSNNSSSDSGSGSSDASKKLDKAKVSKFGAYLYYDPDEFTYDEEQLELFSKDDQQYLYGEVYDETQIERENKQFDERAKKTNLSDVKYGEMDLDNYHAKTVTYKSSGGYSKEYFIVFEQKVGEWAVAAKVFAMIGDDLSNEAKVDAVAKTFEVNPERKTEDQ